MDNARQIGNGVRVLSVLAVAFFVFSGFSGATVTDSEQNAVTGNLESVGLDNRGAVVHFTDPGPMYQKITVLLSSNEGIEPRLSISEDGDTSVIWVDETSGDVVYTKRDVGSQTWSPALTVTSDAVAGTTPALVAAGNTAWVVYEVEDNGDRLIEETEIIDSAEPFLTSPVEVISGSQDADLHLFHESGSVWVAWDDGPTLIGWSELESPGLWTVAQTMACNPGNPAPTYLAIQNLVLAP